MAKKKARVKLEKGGTSRAAKKAGFGSKEVRRAMRGARKQMFELAGLSDG